MSESTGPGMRALMKVFAVGGAVLLSVGGFRLIGHWVEAFLVGFILFGMGAYEIGKSHK